MENNKYEMTVLFSGQGNTGKSKLVIELENLVRTDSSDKINVIDVQGAVIRDLQDRIERMQAAAKEDDYWLGRISAERDVALAKVKELEMENRALVKKNGVLEADLTKARETIQELKQQLKQQIGKEEK